MTRKYTIQGGKVYANDKHIADISNPPNEKITICMFLQDIGTKWVQGFVIGQDENLFGKLEYARKHYRLAY